MLRILAISAVFLAGCGPSRQEMVQHAQESCFSYGFNYGTPQFAQCMMQTDQQNQQMDFQRRQAVAQGLREMGRSMQAQEPVRVAPRTCTSRPMGNQVITDCQ